MRALVVAEREPELKIEAIDVPEPEIGPDDLLVEVVAAGLNWADLRAGHVNFGGAGAAGPVIPGLEMAGRVVATGRQVADFAPGDRVMGMATQSLAERVKIDRRRAVRVPDSMTWEAAGSSMVSLLTAHDALFTNGGLGRGQSVFIHAATSGVGLAAVQMAKAAGATLIAGSGSNAAKLDAARHLGLGLAVNYREEDFLDVVLEATGGEGVDLILDTVGAGVLDRNMRAVRVGGRIIGVGRFGGKTDEIDLDLLALRRVSLIGVTFRTRTIEEHGAVVRTFLEDFAADLATGRLGLPIAGTFGLNAAQEAFRTLAARDHVGKLVVRFAGDADGSHQKG